MKNKFGFTLLELLVVVLIIGILASIALPQYRTSVYKARMSVGVSFAASLYEAQHLYYLDHGIFATDIDELAVEPPKDESCEKWEEPGASGYECKDWQIDIENSTRSINFSFPRPGPQIGYMYVFKDIPNSKIADGKYKAGSKYCYAKAGAKHICENMGGTYVYASSLWTFYEMK